MKNRHMFELRLGKAGLILFIGGMSLLLFSVFLLGILIGKQMEAYPERYSSGVTELIRDSLLAVVSTQGKGAVSAENRANKEDQAADSADFGLTFYETLGGKKTGAVAGTPAGSAKHKASETVTEQDVLPEAPTEKPSTEVPGVKREPSPAVSGGEAGGVKSIFPPERTPAGGPGTQPPPSGEEAPEKGRYEVQVAAYREKPQAEQLAKKLKASGFSPRVVMKELPGKGRWFRVIVDGFKSRETAQEGADQMAGKVRGLKFVIRSSGP